MREISRSVQSYIPYLKEYFSESFRQKYSLNDLLLSLRALHFPVDEQSFRAAKRRLIFDELFFLTLPYVLRRHSVKQGHEAVPLQEKTDMIPRYIRSLPYSLTGAQSRVLSEIKADLTKSSSMNRLLQGDVGAGKTELAVLTLLMAVDNGLAAALLAPTEILAEQHYFKFQRYLEPLGVPIFLLINQRKTANKTTPIPAIISIFSIYKTF